MAAWFANFALSFWMDRANQALWPLVWPVLFAAPAALIVAFILQPDSTQLYKLAGTAGMVALGAQAVRLVPNALVDGLDQHDWSRWGGMGLWLGAAALFSVVWGTEVGKFHDARRLGYDLTGVS